MRSATLTRRLPTVFISYRRIDSMEYARQVQQHLAAALGSHRVFIDINSVGPGEDFTTVTHDTLLACDVVLALIGPSWTSTFRKVGIHGRDFVREELTQALHSNVRVIPVLVGSAKLPVASDLPSDLIQLISCGSPWHLRKQTLRQDIDSLIDEVCSNTPRLQRINAARRMIKNLHRYLLRLYVAIDAKVLPTTGDLRRVASRLFYSAVVNCARFSSFVRGL